MKTVEFDSLFEARVHLYPQTIGRTDWNKLRYEVNEFFDDTAMVVNKIREIEQEEKAAEEQYGQLLTQLPWTTIAITLGKVPAVKAHYERTGSQRSLKESKDAVEAFLVDYKSTQDPDAIDSSS